MVVAQKVEVKQLIKDYILLVYDIPANQAKTRYEFLKKAKEIGAMPHTQSCYLLPYSEKAMEMASEVAAVGDAVVWKSTQQDEKKALEITTDYESHIKLRCDRIEQRLAIAQDYMNDGKLGKANLMGIKTGKLLGELAKISENFSPAWFVKRLNKLVTDWKKLYEPKQDKEQGGGAN
jgi:hypothetical protein